MFYGIDFENSGITYIGTWTAYDYEAITALAPDLILEYVDAEEDHIEKLRAAGPVVLLPVTTEPFAFTRAIADAAGVLPKSNLNWRATKL